MHVIRKSSPEDDAVEVGELPYTEENLLLREGDRLVLTGDGLAGVPTVHGDGNHVVSTVRIACPLPEVL